MSLPDAPAPDTGTLVGLYLTAAVPDCAEPNPVWPKPPPPAPNPPDCGMDPKAVLPSAPPAPKSPPVADVADDGAPVSRSSVQRAR